MMFSSFNAQITRATVGASAAGSNSTTGLRRNTKERRIAGYKTNGNTNSTDTRTTSSVNHIMCLRKQRKDYTADGSRQKHRQPSPHANRQIKLRIRRAEIGEIATLHQHDLIGQFAHDGIPVFFELEYTGVALTATEIEC